MPSPFEGKRVLFYCIKQCLMYFDIPLFELPSLAGRLSIDLIWGFHYVCARDFWKECLFCPRGEKHIYQCLVDYVKAQLLKNISKFYFCSLSKLNIHQKEISDGFFKRNYFLLRSKVWPDMILWPIRVFVVTILRFAMLTVQLIIQVYCVIYTELILKLHPSKGS